MRPQVKDEIFVVAQQRWRKGRQAHRLKLRLQRAPGNDPFYRRRAGVVSRGVFRGSRLRLPRSASNLIRIQEQR
jgi:hypothetical protein